MIEIFWDALNDSLRTVPLLLLIYVGIELLEYKFGNQIREWVGKAGRMGPLAGAMAGAFPQCGFSVMVTALYSQRLVTIGTLIAVYVSTSDEAIPIIMSRPDGFQLVWPIMIVNIVIAVIAGYVIDLVLRKDQKKIVEHIEAIETGHDNKSHHHEVVVDEVACCGHSTSCASKKFKVKEIIWHPILHTLNVFGFIFATTLVISLLLLKVNLAIFDNVFITALIGLIPNCASSVAITELYLNGTIGFGPTMAGLSASGGLGLLVLYREEKNKKVFLKILGLLYGISVVAGLIIARM